MDSNGQSTKGSLTMSFEKYFDKSELNGEGSKEKDKYYDPV